MHYGLNKQFSLKIENVVILYETVQLKIKVTLTNTWHNCKTNTRISKHTETLLIDLEMK